MAQLAPRLAIKKVRKTEKKVTTILGTARRNYRSVSLSRKLMEHF